MSTSGAFKTPVGYASLFYPVSEQLLQDVRISKDIIPPQYQVPIQETCICANLVNTGAKTGPLSILI